MSARPDAHYGLYRGVCFDNNDPQNRHRIRLTCPQVLGSDVTEWVWPCLRPAESATLTGSAVPAIGQGVWVMFEGGDPDFPVWVGVY